MYERLEVRSSGKDGLGYFNIAASLDLRFDSGKKHNKCLLGSCIIVDEEDGVPHVALASWAII